MFPFPNMTCKLHSKIHDSTNLISEPETWPENNPWMRGKYKNPSNNVFFELLVHVDLIWKTSPRMKGKNNSNVFTRGGRREIIPKMFSVAITPVRAWQSWRPCVISSTQPPGSVWLLTWPGVCWANIYSPSSLVSLTLKMTKHICGTSQIV